MIVCVIKAVLYRILAAWIVVSILEIYSHLNEVPNAIKFPIKMLIPNKSSYTLDELKSIFGDNLTVDYYTDGMDGPGYSVTVRGKYYIQFTNGTHGMYDNSEITSPFTNCYINRFNSFN